MPARRRQATECGGSVEATAPKKIPHARRMPHSEAFARALCKNGIGDKLFATEGRKHVWAQNVVTKVRLAQSVDLRHFSSTRFNAYRPEQFMAAAMRTKDQQTSTGLIFRTGRVVVVGTHSLPQTYQTAHRIRLALGEAGRHTLFDEFWLVNMVYNTRVDTDHGIDIASIYKNNLDKTEWVPPMFPGLKYSMEEEHVKLRIFDTRAVVVMGATRPARINTIFRKVTDMATKNPDYYLPDTDERYAYREAKRREVFRDKVMTSLADTEIGDAPTRTGE